MSDVDPVFKDIADHLADLAKRVAAVEVLHETLAQGLTHERELQRQTLGLLVQLLERQTESLKRVEAKLHEAPPPATPTEPTAPKRQAVVKGQVLVARPKAAAKPKAKPRQDEPDDEIDLQISEAIGNISAMLKKQSGRKRKG